VFVCAFFFECQDCLLNVVLLFHGTCYLFQTSCCQIPSRRCIRLQFDYHFGTEDLDFQKGCPFGFFQNDSFFVIFFLWKPSRTEPVNLYNGNMPPCHKPIAICFIIKFHPKFDVVLNRMRMCQPCGDHCQH
jgi:hypothetical protein